MIAIKNERELESMRKACKITAAARALAGEMVRPGVSTKTIDKAVYDYIVSQGAKPSFLNYNGFPASTCISVNATVIHGIPGGYILKEGDIVSIEIVDDVIEGRMTGRRVCSRCGASYHIVANPPMVEGKCDHCGGDLMIRKDDAPETVHRRLEVYHEQTEVLKDFYAKLGKLRLVEGNQTIEGANEDILKAIGAK